MKYAVITQDRTVFQSFQDALAVEPVKLSSALAAKTILNDKDNKFDFVVVDLDLKNIKTVVALVQKNNVPIIKLGEELKKPLESISIQNIVREKTAVKDDNSNDVNDSDDINVSDDLDQEDSEEIQSIIYAANVEKVLNSSIIDKSQNEMIKELESLWEEDRSDPKAKTLSDQEIPPELVEKLTEQILSKIQVDPNFKESVRLKIKTARQMVAAVWSVKPGVGKTTLAVNLGVIYAQAGLRTLVVDADVLSFSVGNHLEMVDSLKNMERALKETDPLKYEDYVLQHPGINNLYIVSGSENSSLEECIKISQGSLVHMVNHLRGMFDVILIDTSSNPLLDITRDALAVANKVITVLDLDLAGAFPAKKIYDYLAKYKIYENKFQYVLNKDFKSSKVSKEILEKHMGITINSSVQNVYEKCVESVFDTRPITLYNSSSTQAVRNALIELASDVFPFLDGYPEKGRNNSSLITKLFSMVNI